MKFIFATGNPNKVIEIIPKLPDFVDVKGLEDIGFKGEIPETQPTIAGNAHQKATYIFDRYRTNVFAEDTGLEIEALDGRPGVVSARYAGPDKSAEDNMKKVLAEMEGVENRSAKFITIIGSYVDGVYEGFVGIVRGTIAHEMRGDEGFGYDPIFIPEGHTETFAELGLEKKVEMSHRARALKEFINYLNEIKKKKPSI